MTFDSIIKKIEGEDAFPRWCIVKSWEIKLKLLFQKGKGSKCKEDTKTDTVPPTSSPFKASKLTGSQSHNEKMLRVLGLGFGWATRCVWASLRLVQTVGASWIQPVGCEIYKGMLRYHIFTASHWLKKNALRGSPLPTLPCYSCGISVKEWMNEKMESTRRTALPKPFLNWSSSVGLCSCRYSSQSLTSQCQIKKKSLKSANHNPRRIWMYFSCVATAEMPLPILWLLWPATGGKCFCSTQGTCWDAGTPWASPALCVTTLWASLRNCPHLKINK